MSDVIEKNVEDLYLEHSQHGEMIPARCSECDREVRELTEDKRREEAEQMERDDSAKVESLSDNQEE